MAVMLMTLYLLVTADKYELPLAVCDSAGEVAELLGRVRGDIYSTISRKLVSQETFNGHKFRIIKVEVDDEDGEDTDHGCDS